MFFREKRSGPRTYLQIVDNRWEEGRARQRVVATIGRVEELRKSGELERLLRSGARFSEHALLLAAHARGDLDKVANRHLGPGLVFDRLWRETGCQAVLTSLLRGRQFAFPVERAVFLAVLQRLMAPGSDRAGDRWHRDYLVAGGEGLALQHLYRAMAWLGEPQGAGEQGGATPFAPRCTKDLVEEQLFLGRRDLFTGLDLVFFDTTSIYFEGRGGETLGRRGKSKDHRPDLRQMVVGAVLDGEGRPLCCELRPGNTTDVKTLVAVVKRLQARFHVGRVCVVADRGMISKETVQRLEDLPADYILGARMRSTKEVREEVLTRAGRYHVVHGPRRRREEPSPLKVKEVLVEGRRYVVCVNEEQVRQDAEEREAIVAALREALTQGDKALVGNKGFRKYLAGGGPAFRLDEEKVAAEARYDGKWVLRTNTSLPAEEVARRYKQLWMVERLFRSAKTLLETRPVFHQTDAAIRGHVFCSFLALVLAKELQDRLEAHEVEAEWADVLRDLNALEETEVAQDGKRFLLRSDLQGVAGKVLQAVGVAVPPTVRQLSPPADRSTPLCHGATPPSATA